MSVPTSQPEPIQFQFFIPVRRDNVSENDSTDRDRPHIPSGIIFFGSGPEEFIRGGLPPSIFMGTNSDSNPISLEDIITRIVETHSTQDAYKPRPASENAVSSLPEYQIKEDSELLSEDSNGCSICLDNFLCDQVVNHMPCHHVFHKECLSPWLKQSHSCPSCRYPLLTEDSEFNEKVLQDLSKRSGCIMQSIHLCEHPEDDQHANLVNLTCGHSYHSSCFDTSLSSTNQNSQNETIRCPYCRRSSQILSEPR